MYGMYEVLHEMWVPVTGSRYARGNGLLLHPIQVTLRATVLCVQVCTMYTKCLLPAPPNETVSQCSQTLTRSPSSPRSRPLCTLDPLFILRNDSSRFYQSRCVGAHSGTGAPREDNPLGWGGNLVKLFTLLLSPLRLRLSFPAPPQLAAVLLPLCSWALLVSTAAVTSCQISHRAVTALAAPLCTNTLHSWFFSLFTGHVSFPGSSLSAQSPDAPGNHACIRSTAGNALFEVYTETHGLRCIS